MKWIVGIDEVGRGPLAGPVYVCAVAMPLKRYQKIVLKDEWKGLTDSKKMTFKNREKWHAEARTIEKRGALKVTLSNRTARVIDRKGIAVCIRECVAEAIEKLQIAPNDCIIKLDGSLKAPSQYKNQTTIIKGDLKEKIISLASVIAKVQRDHVMVALHRKHSSYDWHNNKGYGTRAHIAAMQKWGQTPFHRMTFLKKLL